MFIVLANFYYDHNSSSFNCDCNNNLYLEKQKTKVKNNFKTIIRLELLKWRQQIYIKFIGIPSFLIYSRQNKEK